MKMKGISCPRFGLLGSRSVCSKQKMVWRCGAGNPEQINRLEAKLRFALTIRGIYYCCFEVWMDKVLPTEQGIIG